MSGSTTSGTKRYKPFLYRVCVRPLAAGRTASPFIHNLTKASALAAVLALPAAAQPGALSRAWEQARETVRFSLAATSQLLRAGRHASFPAPSSEDRALLSSRLSGVDLARVRVVPNDVLDELLARSVAAGSTYMDLLTDPILRASEVFYLPASGLTFLDQKYVTGALPYSGTAKDGRPFRMTALAAGAGRVDFVYDRTDAFEFASDTGSNFKILAGGRVSAAIEGPGVLADIKGAQVYGCSGLCVWADFLKWRKEGAQLRVWVKAFGSTKERVVPLRPVRVK